MKGHEEIRELLWDFADGNAENSEEIQAHIASCDACRSRLEDIKKIKSAIADTQREPRGDIRAAVMSKLSAKRSFRPYFGIATAAALVIAAALIFTPKLQKNVENDMVLESGLEQSEPVALTDGEAQIVLETAPTASNAMTMAASAEAPAEKSVKADAIEESAVETDRGTAFYAESLDDYKRLNDIVGKTADIVINGGLERVEELIIAENLYTYSLYDRYIKIDGEHYSKILELLASNSFEVIYSEPYDGAESTIIYSSKINN